MIRLPSFLALAALLAGCVPPPLVAVPEPDNVGDAALAARAYHDGGDYARGIAIVDAAAGDWIDWRASRVTKPALVLDVDETALSNWAIILRDDFGRPVTGACTRGLDTPCGWAAADQLGDDPPIGPTAALFARARARNVAIFFISGRPEDQRAATERNLRNVGFAGYTRLFLVPPGQPRAASVAAFKAPIRAAIAGEGYTIIANVGDQPSDLIGGYAERAFQLPDPFYRVP